ncbi:hypothetical protein D3C84_1002130 [compost metagenome]
MSHLGQAQNALCSEGDAAVGEVQRSQFAHAENRVRDIAQVKIADAEGLEFREAFQERADACGHAAFAIQINHCDMAEICAQCWKISADVGVQAQVVARLQ